MDVEDYVQSYHISQMFEVRGSLQSLLGGRVERVWKGSQREENGRVVPNSSYSV